MKMTGIYKIYIRVRFTLILRFSYFDNFLVLSAPIICPCTITLLRQPYLSRLAKPPILFTINPVSPQQAAGNCIK
jgi:hypothetical protein